LNDYNKLISLKHSYPSLHNSKYVIVIYKDFEKWSKSYKKWSNKVAKKETWENYLEKSHKIDSEKCLIISHDELFYDYENTIKKISKKFNLKLKDIPIIQPTGYFNKGGAESTPIDNVKYIHE